MSKRKKDNGLIKTEEELKLMKIAGRICAEALKEALSYVKEGVTCSYLDKVARQKIEESGASSSFMTVDGYKWTICTTINEQVVHGVPTDREIADGDIIGVDIGACYQGYHSDMAITVPVGQVNAETDEFIKIGRETLKKAIAQVKVGNRVGDISAVIQQEIEQAGYNVVKNLTGHGIGRELHESPMVPCFGKAGTGPPIMGNMVLAIEVIYTKGSGEVKGEDDHWTIVSADGSLGGLFEQTVALTKNGPIVLTPFI